MSLILGLDFETTGLDPEKDRIIEVGAVLWDWDRRTPLELLSSMCWEEETYPALTENITEITGITVEDLKRHHGRPWAVFQKIENMMVQADYMMAYNAPFDRSFMIPEMARHKEWRRTPAMIDAMLDLPLEEKKHPVKRLFALAASHGFVNPFPHRAVFDVLTMLKIASQYALNKILERASSPSVTIQAIVSFDEKEKAKALGFHWDGGTKRWLKVVKMMDLVKTEFPFEIAQVKS